MISLLPYTFFPKKFIKNYPLQSPVFNYLIFQKFSLDDYLDDDDYLETYRKFLNNNIVDPEDLLYFAIYVDGVDIAELAVDYLYEKNNFNIEMLKLAYLEAEEYSSVREFLNNILIERALDDIDYPY